jgi:serine/threonine protein kinase
LVLEYLDGETLATRLENGALPLAQALTIAIETAEAIDWAHRAGITHRDLKPGNVMLTRAGAKLMDFGLAKTTRPPTGVVQAFRPAVPGGPEGPHYDYGESNLPTMPRQLTAQGTILGTLQYMAPEQLEGKEADARADIFAFGAVLYEMVTGKKAFEGKTQASLISAIMSGEPPAISTLQPLTPPVLDRIVKKCLAKDPERRWQAVSDLRDELQWVADAGSQAGVPAPVVAPRASRERWWIVSMAVALVAIAALAIPAARYLRESTPDAL